MRSRIVENVVGASQQTETILVVDDNLATRYATVRVLKQAGFRVLEAVTGAEALKMANNHCDLIVLDINLPDLDGHEVCRQIRVRPNIARIPVIHLSASFVLDIDKIRGLQSGADGYLTHPVEPLVLVATVNAFLRARRVEVDLASSEAKFRAIFDQALIGICLLSNDMIYLDVNPAMCRLLGRPSDEIIGKHSSAFVRAGQERLIEQISQELEQNGSWFGSLPVLHSKGNIVELEWKISIHSAPNVRLAMVTDVTEKRHIEVQREQFLESERAARTAAERADRLKDEFLATLSHELRTPLNAIVGWTQLLKLQPPSAQDLAEGLDTIERNAKIQVELINDLLDVSRIISGKLRLNVQLLDPVVVVREAIASMMPAARAKGIRVEQHVDDPCDPISGDAARLQQVIWNLVSNAVKFTPRNGCVRVILQQTAASILIDVVDSGQGIKPEFLPHLFERFRQEDASSTRVHAGLGLGLAIVKHLVELHGGTVKASSQGEGQGARFTVELPRGVLSRDQHPAPIPTEIPTPVVAPVSPQDAQIKGVRVLLVDDDQDARHVAGRVLREFGAEVQEAGSAEEALNHLATFEPNILVSDIGMPQLDGYDLIREVRRRGYSSEQLPAIAVTAFVRTEDRHRVLSEGYQVHLGKPIAPSELVLTISILTGKCEI